MNKKQLIVVWAVCIYSYIFIMLLYAKETATENEIIKDIQEKYTIINETEPYKKVEKDLMDRSTEGGRLIGYFDGDKLRKIVAILYGEMGKEIDEYYFWKGSLFFAFTQYLHYVHPIGSDIPVNYKNPVSEDIGEITENRYYFKDDRMIRWLNSERKEVDAGNPAFKEREIGLIEEAKEFMKMLQ